MTLCNFIYFIYIFHRINSFLILSMNVLAVDDCIRKIELDDGTNLFENNNDICYVTRDGTGYNSPLFTPIPYEIGQKIKIIIGDISGECYFKMDIFINNKALKHDDIKFWSCDNCVKKCNDKLNCYFSDSNRNSKDFLIFILISTH